MSDVFCKLTLVSPDGVVLDRWDVHWSDVCEDLKCDADLHTEDLETLTGVLTAARMQMASVPPTPGENRK